MKVLVNHNLFGQWGRLRALHYDLSI